MGRTCIIDLHRHAERARQDHSLETSSFLFVLYYTRSDQHTKSLCGLFMIADDEASFYVLTIDTPRLEYERLFLPCDPNPLVVGSKCLILQTPGRFFSKHEHESVRLVRGGWGTEIEDYDVEELPYLRNWLNVFFFGNCFF